ncbi:MULTISPECIES: hemolysin family protein [unclassified Mucilaginibacter]|uniref:hemolysin family protein n=1 Tax=unclassified Mucilaginibacter TaxID=2617802 RepID=UPI002AC8B4A4|nr:MULTISPECIES: hemolysin family protein [unclassified Mucilaginibacter]MEB0262148.1 hemolysin family protein [Mucilaginibacter sp. 10I4]MEB0279809.1 hemolysin family protein [Mucilaginibacter sp. 10B2]MEB0301239.1 hemolysin family protein [Mucilaginibacter sp. 5C4]WPX24219.1 hemolysin family protein [Mucilaginibacter sp. 5C4]
MDPGPYEISAFYIFLTIFLVLLNGFFVAAEFAIVRVRGSQIELKAKSGSGVAKVARGILHNLDGYLAATQLGITIASLGLGVVGEGVVTNIVLRAFLGMGITLTPGFITASHVLSFVAITVLHIVFGELAPKSLAIQKSVRTTLAVSLPLRFFFVVFRPFIWLLNGFANFILKLFGINTLEGGEAHHSSEELQFLLDQGKETGALDSNEHELIQNVFDFNERVVKNIMVPRTKISGIELDTSKEVLLEILITEGYSRMPVFDEVIDKIVGIVHAKDILPLLARGEQIVLKDIIRKPYFIPETKKINDLMAELQQKRIQIAIVSDEFGGTAGMVTLEDIVEELVGEIQDEFDEEKPIVEKLNDREFVVNALAPIYDVNEHLPHDLPEDGDFDTVSGWLGHIFGKIPDVGEQKESNGYNITVLKKSDQNIESVKLELLINEEDAVDLH